MRATFFLRLLLFIVFLTISFTTIAQANTVSKSDDEFNVFLLTFAAFFVCLMIGAAIVGAFVAAMFALLFVSLLTIGIVSTSVAVGLYKRSLLSGFKTFFVICFGFGCAVCGTALSLLGHHFFARSLSLQGTLLSGFLAGGFGRSILGLSAFFVLQTFLRKIHKKFIAA